MTSPWLKLLRPHHWTKNAFCFAGLIFGERFSQPWAVADAVGIFAAFCAASSATYILNDILDVDRDKHHPKKRFRPLPSGAIQVKQAGVVAVLLAALAIVGTAVFGVKAWVCLCAYLAVNLAYSKFFKHEPLLDVGCIALGFVLRLLAGIYAINDIPTTWVTLCTLFLALFLGFAKRRSELKDGPEEGAVSPQRPVLEKYNSQFLDSLLNSTATMTIMSYALFTVTSGKNPSLVVTVPIVCYAVMQYKLLVMVDGDAEEPERILLRNRPIQVSIVLWLACYLLIIYGNVRLFR